MNNNDPILQQLTNERNAILEQNIRLVAQIEALRDKIRMNEDDIACYDKKIAKLFLAR